MNKERVEVLVVEVPNSPGTLCTALQQVSAAGIDLWCLVAAERGSGPAFVYALPKPGQGHGPFKTRGAIIITGEDQLGSAVATLMPIADAGLNLRACGAYAEDGEMRILAVPDDFEAAWQALA